MVGKLIAPVCYYPLSLWDLHIVLGSAAVLWSDYSWASQRVSVEINPLNYLLIYTVSKGTVNIYYWIFKTLILLDSSKEM